MLQCAISGNLLPNPLYTSQGNKSITSLSKVYESSTVVYLDEEIGHLQTQEIASIDEYYDEQYQFFDQSEEDDIIYKVVEGKKIYRQQHQVDTLLQKVQFSDGMRVLDYGCAKGTVMKRLVEKNPNVVPHLFDVSKMYVHLWEKFLKPEQYASYQPKNTWQASFDIITSFFAFEHTPDPLKELATIKNLLKEDGLVYIIVPNVFENIADFIVADHVHHYSEISLRYMFAKAGFETVEIDTQSHFGAYIAVGKKTAQTSLPFEPNVVELTKVVETAKQCATYWDTSQARIRSFEQNVGTKKAAIYGAGVYGSFIATCLQNLGNIQCFTDQNPLLQGTEAFDKPILTPIQLPEDIQVIYVGLNPTIAKKIIANIESWQNKSLEIFFL